MAIPPLRLEQLLGAPGGHPRAGRYRSTTPDSGARTLGTRSPSFGARGSAVALPVATAVSAGRFLSGGPFCWIARAAGPNASAAGGHAGGPSLRRCSGEPRPGDDRLALAVAHGGVVSDPGAGRSPDQSLSLLSFRCPGS